MSKISKKSPGSKVDKVMSKKLAKDYCCEECDSVDSVEVDQTQGQLTGGDWSSYTVGAPYQGSGGQQYNHYATISTTYPPMPYTHTHTMATNTVASQAVQPANELPTEGIDELCKMLGVTVTQKTDGVLLLGSEGKYSLVEVISAQLKIMQKLHVLLVQTDLTPESGE